MAAEDLLTLFQHTAETDPEAARALVHIVVGGTEMDDPVVAKELSDALLQSVLIDILMSRIEHPQIALVMGRRVVCLMRAQQAHEARERINALGPIHTPLFA